ncbi:MAG: hypothetical protein ACTSQO_14185 [Candidatus Helarchaeota archaeon]
MSKKSKVSICILFYIVLIPIFSVSFPTIIHEHLYKNHMTQIRPSNTSPWGDIQIFNVILNKTIIELGEGILINASYRIVLNPNWSIHHILFGIKSDRKLLGEYMQKICGNLVNISKTFYFDPYLINISQDFYGYLEIVAFNDINPSNKVTIVNKSLESIYFEKAHVNCEIIYQYPELIFSSDDTFFSFQFTNAINNTFAFSNEKVLFELEGENISYYTRYTDEDGIINITLNTSKAGTHLCYLYIYINETFVYLNYFKKYTFQITDESAAFHFSVDNADNLYVNTGFNDSFSNIEIHAFCNFNAKVYWNSSNGLIELTDKINNNYYKTIKTPTFTCEFPINLIAVPEIPGNNLSITKYYEIKKRPINIFYQILRHFTNQKAFMFNISILDNLTHNKIKYGNISISYYDFSVNNWSLINKINLKNNYDLPLWTIPENYNLSKIFFKIELKNNSKFDNWSTMVNITPPILRSFQNTNFYPLSTNITLKYQLKFINGTPIINQSISIWIGNKYLSLNTDSEGYIEFTYLTPAASVKIPVRILYEGNNECSLTTFQETLIIKMDMEQRLFYNSGYIVAFIILSFGTVLTISKIKRPKTISDIKVK